MTFSSTPSQLALAARVTTGDLSPCVIPASEATSAFLAHLPTRSRSILECQLCLRVWRLTKPAKTYEASSCVIFQPSTSPSFSWLPSPMTSSQHAARTKQRGTVCTQTRLLYSSPPDEESLLPLAGQEELRRNTQVSVPWLSNALSSILALPRASPAEPPVPSSYTGVKNLHARFFRRQTAWPVCRTHTGCWVAAPANQKPFPCEPPSPKL